MRSCGKCAYCFLPPRGPPLRLCQKPFLLGVRALGDGFGLIEATAAELDGVPGAPTTPGTDSAADAFGNGLPGLGAIWA